MPPGIKPLILIVEDEKELAAMISDQLETAGMTTQVFHRASNVTRYLGQNHANLMLLDVNLPDRSGYELFDEIKRKDIKLPVIFLTGNDSELDKVKGLNMGGDDYICKPFSFPELIARINAVLRRTEMANDHSITNNVSLTRESFKFCEAEIAPNNMEVNFPNGEMQRIGRKELGILSHMVSNPNTVLTRRSLIHAVWGIHADVKSRSLDQYIVKIRDNFARSGCDLTPFRTIHGVGYIYEPEAKKLPILD